MPRCKNMTPEQRCRRKVKKACCCITFLLLINILMLLWISSRTSFVAWYLSDPDNQMMVELDQNTFCGDICGDLKCGLLPCNQDICISECNTSMQQKLNLYEFDSSSSSSSSSEDGDEERMEVADEQRSSSGSRHHGRHHGRHSGSRSGSHDGHHGHHGRHGRHGGKHKFHGFGFRK